jgi:hypothetical protein
MAVCDLRHGLKDRLKGILHRRFRIRATSLQTWQEVCYIPISARLEAETRTEN